MPESRRRDTSHFPTSSLDGEQTPAEWCESSDLAQEAPTHVPRKTLCPPDVDPEATLASGTNHGATPSPHVLPEPAGPAADLPSVPGYEILSVLGRGGMGVVFLARQSGLKRLVALKMIRAGGSAGADDFTRFRTEAEVIAKLQHPTIIQIFEVGAHNGQPFFSLEYVSGGSLDKQLAHVPQAPPDAARLTATLARGIHAAHRVGVIHRDLKPANVLVTEHGTFKITDFGMAKKLDDATGQTLSGAIMGTPSYMAPEQASGQIHATGPASDVYALGAILYEALTGRPPFRGATVYETIAQVLEIEPVPPSRLQPKVGHDLETICLKCLSKDPAKRYASAEALADDLDHYLNDEPILARRAGLLVRGLKYTRRKPWVVGAWAAAATALLLLIAGGGYFLHRRNLDLQAALAHKEALEDRRGRGAAGILTAEEALEKREWATAAAAAKQTLVIVDEEPGLANLKERASSLFHTAESVRRFTVLHDSLMFHAVLAREEGDRAWHRREALSAARMALAQFGSRDDGLPSPPRFPRRPRAVFRDKAVARGMLL